MATKLKRFIMSSDFKHELITIIKNQQLNLSSTQVDAIYEHIKEVPIRRLNTIWINNIVKFTTLKVRKEMPFTYKLIIPQKKIQTIVRKVVLAIIAKSKNIKY